MTPLIYRIPSAVVKQKRTLSVAVYTAIPAARPIPMREACAMPYSEGSVRLHVGVTSSEVIPGEDVRRTQARLTRCEHDCIRSQASVQAFTATHSHAFALSFLSGLIHTKQICFVGITLIVKESPGHVNLSEEKKNRKSTSPAICRRCAGTKKPASSKAGPFLCSLPNQRTAPPWKRRTLARRFTLHPRNQRTAPPWK